MADYEKRIADLKNEVSNLNEKIPAYAKAFPDVRRGLVAQREALQLIEDLYAELGVKNGSR